MANCYIDIEFTCTEDRQQVVRRVEEFCRGNPPDYLAMIYLHELGSNFRVGQELRCDAHLVVIERMVTQLLKDRPQVVVSGPKGFDPKPTVPDPIRPSSHPEAPSIEGGSGADDIMVGSTPIPVPTEVPQVPKGPPDKDNGGTRRRGRPRKGS